MSLDFTDLVPIASGRVTATIANNTIVYVPMGKSQSWLVHTLEVGVIVAGNQATSTLNLQTTDGVTSLATINMGTSAAYTIFSAVVADANKIRAANTALRLIHTCSASDTTAIYSFTLWGTTGAV